MENSYPNKQWWVYNMSITSAGFQKETLEEIIVRLSNQIKESFPSINLTQANIIYQWLKVVALEIYYLQTIVEDTIANITPLGASGMFLEYHALNAGLKRKGTIQAVGTVELTNETELGKYIIPEGSEFSTATGKTYITTESVNFNDVIPVIHTGGGAGSVDLINTKYYDFTVDSLLHNEATYSSGDGTTTLTVVEDLTTYLSDGATGSVYAYNGTNWVEYSYTFASSSPHVLTLGASLDYDSLSVYYQCSGGSYYYSSIIDSNDNTIQGFYSIDSNNKLTWETSMVPVISQYQQYYLQIVTPLTISAGIVASSIGTEGNTGANTITINKNSIEGVDIVNNSASITNGLDEEAESTLRARILEVDNAKTTLQDIKSMIENITGVRHAKASNNTADDRAFPNDWTQVTSSDSTKINIEAGKIVQIAHKLNKQGVSTINGINLRLKDIGTAPNLYVYLASHMIDSFNSPQETHMATASITRSIMVKNGSGTWQDVTVPLEYNGLYSSNAYSINIYCPDGSVSGGNYWQLQIMSMDSGHFTVDDSTGFSVGDTITTDAGSTTAVIESIDGNDIYVKYIVGSFDSSDVITNDGGVTTATLSSGTTSDTSEEANTGWYNLHREWNLEDTLTVVTATAGTTTLTTGAHSITGTGFVVLDGDSYYFSAASTPDFTLDEQLSKTYTAGISVYVYQYDDTNLDTANMAAIYRTLFTNPSFTVSVVPEDSYDFETELKDDIENMLDWEEGGGYAPMCIPYTVQEATKLNIAITAGELSIENNYVFDDVKAEILSNINIYLASLEPGDDIVYSQIEKIVLTTPGVYRFRNMTLQLTRGSDTVESSDDNEIDIVIYDDEYAEMTYVTLTEG